MSCKVAWLSYAREAPRSTSTSTFVFTRGQPSLTLSRKYLYLLIIISDRVYVFATCQVPLTVPHVAISMRAHHHICIFFHVHVVVLASVSAVASCNSYAYACGFEYRLGHCAYVDPWQVSSPCRSLSCLIKFYHYAVVYWREYSLTKYLYQMECLLSILYSA